MNAKRPRHLMDDIPLWVAARGRRRLAAHVEGAGVLHYDRDYDLIAERSGLDFQSEWVAPAGSI